MPNKRLGYFPDHSRHLLWVLPQKCASTSMRLCVGAGQEVDWDDAVMLDYFTVAVIRHPWDRIVSAMYSVLRDSRTFQERMAYYCEGKTPLETDAHVRPCWHWLEGLRVDVLLDVATLRRDVDRLRIMLPHLGPLDQAHEGMVRPPRWQDVGYSWERVMELYRRDLELCLALQH